MDAQPFLRAARLMEGCPEGSEEALLALAGPPLYTPFPNPFVEQFISASPQDCSPTHRPRPQGPMATDIAEGRTDPAYQAQNYHTKVPYRAIARYIEHFTEPGDLVLDGFCGSGMVGVAANQTHRRAILCDLSPAATFMAHSYCHPVGLSEATDAFMELLRDLELECGWLYREPSGTDDLVLSPQPSVLDYVIWSELFLCPRCSVEFPFSEAGFDFQRHRPLAQVTCPSCGAALRPNDPVRAADEQGRTREVPVRVAYTGRHRPRESAPGPEFLELQREIEVRPIPHWYPDRPMMSRPSSSPPNHQPTALSPQSSVLSPRSGWGDMWRRGYHSGMERVSDFYFKRTLWVLATAIHLAGNLEVRLPARHLVLQAIVNSSVSMTRMRRAYQGVLPLVLYVPKLKREVNAIRALESRFRSLAGCLGGLRTSEEVLVTTQSTTSLPNIPDGCVDYIFTDPPFGDNIRYSEMNFLWESWLQVFTNPTSEAIVSPGQRKRVQDYQELMCRCFREMHRVLKPGRWMTVAFHNSDNRVWNAIQSALRESGFEIADVRLLDKRQVSFKQASVGTVRHDLVISTIKATTSRARGELGRGDGETGGRSPQSSVLSPQMPEPRTQNPERDPALSTQTAWDFVHRHLGELPLPEAGDGGTVMAERTGLELFNRMVAFHIEQGHPVPLGARGFLLGLRHRFVERGGMHFLPEQAQEFDRLVASSRPRL